MSTLERRMNKLERAEIGGAELLEAIIVSGMSTGAISLSAPPLATRLSTAVHRRGRRRFH